MQITLPDITDDAAAAYIASRNGNNSGDTDANFIAACIMADMQSAIATELTTQATEQAAAGVVIPDITTDNTQS